MVVFFFALDPEAGALPEPGLPVRVDLATEAEDLPVGREGRAVERAVFRLSVMDALSQNEPSPGQ